MGYLFAVREVADRPYGAGSEEGCAGTPSGDGSTEAGGGHATGGASAETCVKQSGMREPEPREPASSESEVPNADEVEAVGDEICVLAAHITAATYRQLELIAPRGQYRRDMGA